MVTSSRRIPVLLALVHLGESLPADLGHSMAAEAQARTIGDAIHRMGEVLVTGTDFSCDESAASLVAFLTSSAIRPHVAIRGCRFSDVTFFNLLHHVQTAPMLAGLEISNLKVFETKTNSLLPKLVNEEHVRKIALKNSTVNSDGAVTRVNIIIENNTILELTDVELHSGGPGVVPFDVTLYFRTLSYI